MHKDSSIFPLKMFAQRADNLYSSKREGIAPTKNERLRPMLDFGNAAADIIAVLVDTCVDAKSPIVSESFRQEALVNLTALVAEFNARMILDMQANLSKLN